MTDDKLPGEIGDEKHESMEIDWVRKDLNVGAPRPPMPPSYGPPPAPPMAGGRDALFMPRGIIVILAVAILVVIIVAVVLVI